MALQLWCQMKQKEKGSKQVALGQQREFPFLEPNKNCGRIPYWILIIPILSLGQPAFWVSTKA